MCMAMLSLTFGDCLGFAYPDLVNLDEQLWIDQHAMNARRKRGEEQPLADFPGVEATKTGVKQTHEVLQVVCQKSEGIAPKRPCKRFLALGRLGRSSGEDTPRGVVLAADGLPVVCGTVAGWTSSDFPGTAGAGSWDGVVVKYNLDGTQAAIASFATNAEDEVRACVIDSSNNIYVSGFSRGLLPGTFEGGAAPPGIDMFVAKLDSSLNQQWLIQAGSTQGDDKASAIALDSAGNVVVGGSTAATWPEQTRVGSWDSFIIKYEVNNTGGSRQWVIQFGSVGADYLYGLTVDTVSDDIYAAGGTGGEFEGNTHQGGNDMYLIKVSSTGTIVWSRVDGVPSSTSSEQGNAVVVDSAQNVYVFGNTQGQLTGATSNGNQDARLVEVRQRWNATVGDPIWNHRTTVTTTLPEGISPAELEAMEEQRKEEAMQAVAAIEAAETAAVLEAFARIFNGGANRSELLPRVLGEAEVQTEAGPVKVAALSVAAAGEPALISAGAAAGADTVLLSVAEIRGQGAAGLQTDHVLAENDNPARARRLASALRSHPLSINFWRTNGTKIDVNNLQTPMHMVLEVDDPNATCAFWDETLAPWRGPVKAWRRAAVDICRSLEGSTWSFMHKRKMFVCAGKLLHFSSLVLRTVLLLNGTAPTAELYALALLVAFCAERTSEQIDAEHMLMRDHVEKDTANQKTSKPKDSGTRSRIRGWCRATSEAIKDELINGSIHKIQAHRSRACKNTIRMVKSGKEEDEEKAAPKRPDFQGVSPNLESSAGPTIRSSAGPTIRSSLEVGGVLAHRG
eukprot:symbB.v1.2.036391.t1/scaffold5127.1/size30577/4